MTSVVFYFQVHQPFRLNQQFKKHLASKEHKLADLENLYFNNDFNKEVFLRVAKKCYLPANDTWLKAIDENRKNKKKVKISYSLSGTVLEQAERYQPDVIDSFKSLAETGCVEFLGETQFHSLTSLYGIEKDEFIEQINLHKQTMRDLLGITPQNFRNTELILNNSIMKTIAEQGFKGILSEGIKFILPKEKSPDFVFASKTAPDLKVLLRNFKLSDDIAFRFGARNWEEYPLLADKYASWLALSKGDCINLFMDYESLGEHLWEESGIFQFIQHLPNEIFKYDHLDFKTPSEVFDEFPTKNQIDIGDFGTISWADDRDVGAWLRNKYQTESFEKQKQLERPIKKLDNPTLLKLWRMLTTSDHLYYISQADAGPGEVHSYFSHYDNPMIAYNNYNEILEDLSQRVKKKSSE
ncbi:MAG: glycoside hydrolase family 57 protein [Candidatus Heimdallarchaeota archaeon]